MTIFFSLTVDIASGGASYCVSTVFLKKKNYVWLPDMQALTKMLELHVMYECHLFIHVCILCIGAAAPPYTLLKRQHIKNKCL